MAVDAIVSVAGQAVKGKSISSPWLRGQSYEVTQGWGPTPNVYPKDHGTVNWHSGVDIGCPSNTVVTLPAGLLGKAVYLDNPSGYGTALILQLYSLVQVAGHDVLTQRHADILLGHLVTRLVKDGQVVRPGDHLAFTDSTGNVHPPGPAGAHLHFEVRPPDGRYGTDIDPSNYLLSGTLSGTPQPLIPDIGAAITNAEQRFAQVLIGLGQTALGGTMMLAGGAMVGFGVRGMSGKQAARVSRGTFDRLNRRRVERRPVETGAQRPRTAAERSRLRDSLQRETGAPTGSPQASPALSSLSGPRQPTTRAEARGLVPTRYGQPVSRSDAIRLRRALPMKAA